VLPQGITDKMDSQYLKTAAEPEISRRLMGLWTLRPRHVQEGQRRDMVKREDRSVDEVAKLAAVERWIE